MCIILICIAYLWWDLYLTPPHKPDTFASWKASDVHTDVCTERCSHWCSHWEKAEDASLIELSHAIRQSHQYKSVMAASQRDDNLNTNLWCGRELWPSREADMAWSLLSRITNEKAKNVASVWNYPDITMLVSHGIDNRASHGVSLGVSHGVNGSIMRSAMWLVMRSWGRPCWSWGRSLSRSLHVMKCLESVCILNVHYTHSDHCHNHHHNHHTDDQKRSADRGEAHWPVGAVGRRMPNQQNTKIGWWWWLWWCILYSREHHVNRDWCCLVYRGIW